MPTRTFAAIFLLDLLMTLFPNQAHQRYAAVAYLAVIVMLAAGEPCFAQSAPADITPPLIVAPAQCPSVLFDCNAPAIAKPHDQTLLDSATAHDQEQRAKMQADQVQAQQNLQKRIEFAREHPNAIYVFGNRIKTPQESVRDVFAKALSAPSTALTTSTYDSTGHRTECVSACYGPFCCVSTDSAADHQW